MIENSDQFDEILAGCLKKNRASQKKLYSAYYCYGMTICLRYTKNEEEAIELLNDSFLKIFTHIKRYDKNRPFLPWLRRIFINTSISFAAKQLRSMKTLNIIENTETKFSEDILSKIRYQELMRMIQSLSLSYRTVFNMYVIDGYNHNEIAKNLGISVGTSKSNLFKARAKLKEMILQYY